jgi:hypothetical protein
MVERFVQMNHYSVASCNLSESHCHRVGSDRARRRRQGGATPLHIAVEQDNAAIVEALIVRVADVNAIDRTFAWLQARQRRGTEVRATEDRASRDRSAAAE